MVKIVSTVFVFLFNIGSFFNPFVLSNIQTFAKDDKTDSNLTKIQNLLNEEFLVFYKYEVSDWNNPKVIQDVAFSKIVESVNWLTFFDYLKADWQVAKNLSNNGYKLELNKSKVTIYYKYKEKDTIALEFKILNVSFDEMIKRFNQELLKLSFNFLYEKDKWDSPHWVEEQANFIYKDVINRIEKNVVINKVAIKINKKRFIFSGWNHPNKFNNKKAEINYRYIEVDSKVILPVKLVSYPSTNTIINKVKNEVTNMSLNTLPKEISWKNYKVDGVKFITSKLNAIISKIQDISLIQEQITNMNKITLSKNNIKILWDFSPGPWDSFVNVNLQILNSPSLIPLKFSFSDWTLDSNIKKSFTLCLQNQLEDLVIMNETLQQDNAKEIIMAIIRSAINNEIIIDNESVSINKLELEIKDIKITSDELLLKLNYKGVIQAIELKLSLA